MTGGQTLSVAGGEGYPNFRIENTDTFPYFGCQTFFDMPIYKLNIRELDADFIKKLKEEYEDADIEIRVQPVPGSSAPFTETGFWHVISLLDWSKGEDDDEGVIEPAVAYLSALDAESIYRFQDILSEKLQQLDKKVFAQNMGKDSWRAGSPFSSDYFLYARACVVANGKEYFEQVLADPVQMPKGYTFESLLYLAADAYKRKTGQEFEYIPRTSYETYSNPDGWDETLMDRLLGQ